ncbi:Fc receptor-like protein 5 isoform X1 [Ctenopharyngodon idella]|uniref:Fc receptor-like protein 5 isoform X1 n=1 Tax=Ctenopharyngodon idella TaxID=7959 RepID=UPI00222E4BCC|nr:Fc receptor-like protein 5 isoform X1 [Ctenopharyngodon idella]
METFKIFLLTVAVCVQVTSQESTGDPPIPIPKPNITRNSTHKVLYNTETVTLHCEVPGGASELQYDWYKDTANLETDHNFSITVKDGGNYKCKAKNGTSESEKSDGYNLTLQDLPEAQVQSEWTEAFPGEKVSLQCVIPVSENWIYKWFNGSENVSSDETNTLTLSVEFSHVGEYACQAELKGRTVTTAKSKPHLLTVHDNTPKPNITKHQWFEPFYTGEKVQLGCNMPGNGWKYGWWYNDSETLIRDPTFTISSASPSNTGVYHCKARRGNFSVDSETLRVQVEDLPEAQVQSEWTEAFPGEKVSLQCVIPVSQDWIYKWFKDSENVVSSDERSIKDNTLSLSVKSGHEGIYACQAELKGRTVTTVKSTVHSLEVHGSKPTVVLKQDPSYPEIYTGEQVKLICSIKEKTSNWQYQWQKHSVLVNNHTYTIPNATLDQNGEYTCTITRKEMTYTESTKLNIREPPRPKLSIESQWKTFYPTEKVTLKCSIDGGPNEWGYEWFRNRTQLSGDEDIFFSGDTFLISSAKVSHSGQYTCRGKHLKRKPVTTGEAEALQIHIYDNTPKPNITKHQWFEPFYTGEKVQLGCNMPGDGWKYDWYKDKKTLITDPTFNISSASLSDTGVYHCKAKRGNFSVDSENLQVQIEDLPKAQVQSEWTEAFPGEKVSLQCVIPGSENWIYKWFKGSENVVSSDERSIKDNTLTLSVKSGHEGIYACQAELKGRTVTTAKSKIHSLKVHGSKPTVVLRQDPSYPEIYTGEQVKLICSIKEKTSNWQYQWQKHSVLVNDHTYTIPSATLDQNGEYTCTIARKEMTYTESTKLNITEPPRPKLSIESQWKTFYPTEKVTLKCSIDGGPNEWGYEWFRNGAQLSGDEDIFFSRDELSISSAKASHSGQYTCRGKHLKRKPVTTGEAEALKLHIYDDTPKPEISTHEWFEFFYTEEEVQLGCNMPGDGWEFHWYKKPKPLIAKPNHTIRSASLSDTGVYHCKAKRGDFSVDSETLQVQVKSRPPAVLSLETELSDIMSGNILTLRCNVSDGRQWSYAWFENGQKLNGSSDLFKVTATEETIKSEFKCKGIRTERPLYSALSEGFTANNIILKRKILLAISGCLICCIIILIIGCLVLRFTRKPGKKETVQEDLFFSMADSKNQTASPLEEYMDNSPTEMEECEEKEELLTDNVSAVHEDDVIKDEDSPAAEAIVLTSFKGL